MVHDKIISLNNLIENIATHLFKSSLSVAQITAINGRRGERDFSLAVGFGLVGVSRPVDGRNILMECTEMQRLAKNHNQRRKMKKKTNHTAINTVNSKR